jgi:HAD superfamily hydrolase (TIGR01549 family)
MPLSIIRAIFFDAGNTLIYPRVDELARELTALGFPAAAENFYAAERAGKAKLDEWLWPQIRRGQVPRQVDGFYWGEYLRALMEQVRAPQEAQERIMQRVREGFGDIRTWSRVFPETPPFLDSLRAAGYYLGVISNSGGTVEEQLGRVDLRRRFHTVLDSAIVGVEKPHPEIFQLALERAGVEPSRAVFVGDTYATDVGGAGLAGLYGVLIDRVGAYPRAECPRITTLPELAGVLATWSSRGAQGGLGGPEKSPEKKY